jgi:hypothetical protein
MCLARDRQTGFSPYRRFSIPKLPKLGRPRSGNLISSAENAHWPDIVVHQVHPVAISWLPSLITSLTSRMITLDGYGTLVAASLVLLFGRRLVSAIQLLRAYSIPEPVAGGLLVALGLYATKLFFRLRGALRQRTIFTVDAGLFCQHRT